MEMMKKIAVCLLCAGMVLTGCDSGVRAVGKPAAFSVSVYAGDRGGEVGCVRTDGVTLSLYEDGSMVAEGEGEVTKSMVAECLESAGGDEDTVSSIVIEEGIESVGKRAFYGLRKCGYLEIPESVESIGKEAFAMMTSLRRVVSESRAPSKDCASNESAYYSEDDSLHEVISNQSMWFYGDDSIEYLNAPDDTDVYRQVAGCYTDEYTCVENCEEVDRYRDFYISPSSDSVFTASADEVFRYSDYVSDEPVIEVEDEWETQRYTGLEIEEAESFPVYESSSNARYTDFTVTPSYTESESTPQRYTSFSVTSSAGSTYSGVGAAYRYTITNKGEVTYSYRNVAKSLGYVYSAVCVASRDVSYTNNRTGESGCITISATGESADYGYTYFDEEACREQAKGIADAALEDAVYAFASKYFGVATCKVTMSYTDEYTSKNKSVDYSATAYADGESYNSSTAAACAAAYSSAVSLASAGEAALDDEVYYKAESSCTVKLAYTDSYTGSAVESSYTGAGAVATDDESSEGLMSEARGDAL
ncbi:MAG: leucine-rich repeat domain-containing protein [Lachnospiraceae bacterium]|nr:leucine-rich repeat domain-containing protein [Lachnospiraceae bacterium]